MWCFESGVDVDVTVGQWSLCRDKNKILSKSPNLHSGDADKLSVLEDGQLNFASIERFQRDAELNCSVYDEEGHQCAVNYLTFRLLSRSKKASPSSGKLTALGVDVGKGLQ